MRIGSISYISLHIYSEMHTHNNMHQIFMMLEVKQCTAYNVYLEFP